MRTRSRRESQKRKISECYAQWSEHPVASQRISLKKKPSNNVLDQCGESSETPERELIRSDSLDVTKKDPGGESSHADAYREVDVDEEGCSVSREEMVDSDWDDGSVQVTEAIESCVKGVTVEFSDSPDIARRKPPHRASAEEKELAELIHKVHLLCFLARGRLIDRACDDPLIQASLLSLLPRHLIEMLEATKFTEKGLSSLAHWFQHSFKVRRSTSADRPVHSALSYALETQEGTPEEIAALSVALLRAMKFTVRFISVLDVISLKPDRNKSEFSPEVRKADTGIFKSSTVMVAKSNHISASPAKSASSKEKGDGSRFTHNLTDTTCTEHHDSKVSDETNFQGPKRKGDVEFEMQLEIALSATAFEVCESNAESGCGKRLKNVQGEGIPQSSELNPSLSSKPSPVISLAIGANKVGCPLYWSEVYCSKENSPGRWVHFDVVNATVDDEQNVEAAAAACKTSLRYVVAFAGSGAKDVTRRYCRKWYKIASQRVDSVWWNAVLAPLRELESGATGGEEMDLQCSRRSVCVATRSSLEDMELETMALTEPLPTNQQAYKNHHLYALERWLTKYQILHPKGPLLGFCSGYPVYPRTSVQTLKTKERWLREGLQIKANELPAKVLKQSRKGNKGKNQEYDESGATDSEGTIELYGKWQMEPLQLPHAVDGIVPKNERGQVDVWSEKCLPPGTVHLKLPRIFSIAKRLEIDYAPAMVGFEFRNGRAAPVYDGIVVCSEFKDVILEAYAEGEERRKVEERKRNELEAISRWYQLLSSILTRQRLNNTYGDDGLSSRRPQGSPINVEPNTQAQDIRNDDEPSRQQADASFGFSSSAQTEDHEHVFLKEDESFNEESFTKTRRCRCGFSVQVEEL